MPSLRNKNKNQTLAKKIAPRRSFRRQRTLLKATPPEKVRSSRHLAAPAKSQRHHSWRSKIIFGVAIIFAAVALIFLANWLLRFFFSVENITCTVNQNNECPAILVKQLSSLKDRSLFFTNFDKLLNQFRSPNLDFTAVTHQKRLPHTLDLDFTFPPALYKIQTEVGNFYLAPAGNLAYAGDFGLLAVTDKSGTLKNTLLNGQLDDFLHQKIVELNSWRQLHTTTINNLEYYALETVVIPLSDHLYVIDLLNLDEGLQKIDFLEQNWRETENNADYIDLRFKLPVLRQSTDFLTATASGAYNE